MYYKIEKDLFMIVESWLMYFKIKDFYIKRQIFFDKYKILKFESYHNFLSKHIVWLEKVKFGDKKTRKYQRVIQFMLFKSLQYAGINFWY